MVCPGLLASVGQDQHVTQELVRLSDLAQLAMGADSASQVASRKESNKSVDFRGGHLVDGNDVMQDCKEE